jgi:LysM repeat protein
MMAQKRAFLTACGMMVAAGVLVGCTLRAAPDVTPTPSQEQLMEEQLTVVGTRVAEITPTAVVSPLITPTVEPPTAVPPTLEPTAGPTVAPTVAPTVPPAVAPTTVPSGGEQTYVVQAGDTLYRIARRYGMRFEDLAAYNGVVNPHQIRAGQVLRIPAGSSTPPSTSPGEVLYTVQAGDNLFRIALRYNLNYLYLASYNGISNPNTIRVGQVIRIPPAP